MANTKITAANIDSTSTGFTLADLTVNGDINLGDNDKAVFGAGSDLQIYHDSTSGDSRIVEGGTGHLALWGNNIKLLNAAGTETMLDANPNAAVTLYYDNSAKLATSSTGIDVTGSVVADGLDVDGSGDISGNTYVNSGNGTGTALKVGGEAGAGIKTQYVFSGSTQHNWQLGFATHASQVMSITPSSAAGNTTFATPILNLDGANSRVGIGTTSPSAILDIRTAQNSTSQFTSPFIKLFPSSTTNTTGFTGITYGTSTSDNYGWSVGGLRRATSADVGSFVFNFHNNSASGSEKMRIDSTGNVGIGVSSPTGSGTILHLNGSSTVADFHLTNSTSGAASTDGFVLRYSGLNAEFLNREAGNNIFYTAGSERMRITSDGTVAINQSAPSSTYKLDVNGAIRSTGAAPSYTLREDDASNQTWLMGSYGGNFAVRDTTVSGTSYPFQIEAATPTSTMYLDSTGNVGIGTTSPQAELHIEAEPDTAATGPVIRLARNDVYTSPDDSIGMIEFHTNDADSARVGAYIQATNQETYGRLSDLRFGVTQSNNAAATEAMRIDSSGNLLVGTTETPLTLLSDGYSGFGVSSSGDYIVSSRFNGASGYFKRENSNGSVLEFLRDGTGVGSITVTTSSTSYNTSSDYRLKENVVEMTSAIDRVNQLQPKRFNFLSDPDTTVDGFLAHEVQNIVPEAIYGVKDGVDKNGEPDYQCIDQSKLVPLLTKAIQEQQAIIDNLKTRIEALEG